MEHICVPDTTFSQIALALMEMITSKKPQMLKLLQYMWMQEKKKVFLHTKLKRALVEISCLICFGFFFNLFI